MPLKILFFGTKGPYIGTWLSYVSLDLQCDESIEYEEVKYAESVVWKLVSLLTTRGGFIEYRSGLSMASYRFPSSVESLATVLAGDGGKVDVWIYTFPLTGLYEPVGTERDGGRRANSSSVMAEMADISSQFPLWAFQSRNSGPRNSGISTTSLERFNECRISCPCFDGVIACRGPLPIRVVLCTWFVLVGVVVLTQLSKVLSLFPILVMKQASRKPPQEPKTISKMLTGSLLFGRWMEGLETSGRSMMFEKANGRMEGDLCKHAPCYWVNEKDGVFIGTDTQADDEDLVITQRFRSGDQSVVGGKAKEAGDEVHLTKW